MAVASRKIRSRMLMTTALVAVTAIPSAAHAQLVDSGDLSSAVDSAGNPGQLTVTDTSATQTDIEVEAAVVIAEWTDFNIDMGDTVNVTIDAGLGLSEATLFNRVIGANPSNMNGTLNAAGINFWLVNQNGILFGNDAAINAQSFFASTIDVANQDVFDFYEATDLFGNGTNTLNFAGASTNAVQALGNASFVTDGSLAFVGQQLDLTGTFDAQTGRAAFIAASDVDVSFTPGSPLTYTVNAGTTIAAQSIDGTVTGGIVDFAMLTDAGVVGALLDIDASVTATTALATDRGITLLAQGTPTVTVEIGGAFSSTGEVVLSSTGDLTATANIDGSDLDLDAAGAIGVADLTSSDGNVDLNAGTTITAGAIDTSGNGGAILAAAGNITTTSITSDELGGTNGFIDVDSSAGGALDLGALSSDGNIALDTGGSLATDTISTTGDLTIGGANAPTSATFTGNVDAAAIDIDSTGTVTGLNIDATGGNLDIAASVIDADDVSATGGDVILSASGNIATTSITSTLAGAGGAIDVDSTGGGTLDLGGLTGDGAANLDTTGTLTLGAVDVGGALVIGATNQPATLNLTGNIIAGSFAYTTASPFASQDITTTAGDINIDAASITTGALDASAAGAVILTSPGNVTTTSISANGDIDVDSTGGGTLDLGALTNGGNTALDTTGSVSTDAIATTGDLTIGGTATPSNVTFGGNVSATMVDIDATGLVTTADVDATDGNLDINAGSILGGHMTATGGDVILNATGAITTTSLTATRVMGNGGDVDIDSTGGGNLDLGDITADASVTLDTTGVLTYNNIDASNGQIDIGSTATPSAINATGSQTAIEFIINSLTDVNVNDLTATNGVIDIDAPNITAGHLSATGGDVLLTAPGNITTTSITSIESGGMGGAIDVDSTLGGNLDLGDLTSDGLVALDTLGSLTLGTVNAGGALQIGALNMPTTLNLTGNITAATFTFTTLNPFVAQDIATTDGPLTINAASILAGHLSSAGGDLTLSAPGAITTTSLTSNRVMGMGGSIDIDSTGGGNLNLGDITADSSVSLDTLGVLTYNDFNAPNGLLDIGSTAMPSAVIVTGDQTALEFIINSLTDIVVNDLTATNGVIDLDAPNITAGHLSATGGDVSLTAPGNITTTSITSTESGGMGGNIDVDSTLGGDLDLGVLNATGNIALDTTGALTLGDVVAGGSLDIGTVNAPSPITFNGNLTASSFSFNTAAPFTANDITATAGGIDIDAPTITAGHLTATGGDVSLTAPGDITTTSITATEVGLVGGNIDVDSTGGGALDLGDLSADVGITLDTNGTLAAATINATGPLAVGLFAAPTDITLTGGTTASDIALVALNSVTTQALTATAGDIEVRSVFAGPLDLGAVSATNDIILDTSLTISVGDVTADSDTDGTGDVRIGQVIAPTGLTLGGTVTGANALVAGMGITGTDITATAGNAVITGDFVTLGGVSATGGNVILGSLGGGGIVTTTSLTATAVGMVGGNIDVDGVFGTNLNLGDLTADVAIEIDTDGTLDVGTINAGTSLLIGTLITPSAVALAGNSTAGSIDIRTIGALTGTDLTATAGSVAVAADSISANALSATGGDVVLTSAGNTTTASITSVNSGGGGSIDVDSTAGGALSLGILAADGGVSLDTTGSVTTGAVNAGGALNVGSTATPQTIGLTDNVTAASVSLLAITSVSAQDITATAGLIDIDASQQVLGALSATGDIALDGGTSISAASITADSDTSGAGDVLIGTMTAPATLTVAGATTGARVNASGGTATLADVTSSAGAVQLGATTGALSAGIVAANGGDAALVAAGDVTTTSITTAGGNIDVDSTGGGALDLGDLTSDTGIALDTTGTLAANTVSAAGALTVGQTALPSSINFTGNVTAGSMDIDATGALTALDLDATAGGIDIDAGSVLAGLVTATGNVALDATGAITTGNIAGAAGVSVSSTGASVTVGDVAASNLGSGVTIRAAGAASDVTAGTVNSNSGDIFITAERDISATSVSTALLGAPTAATIGLHAGGSITTGQVDAGEDLRIESVGSTVTLAGATAGDDVIISAAGMIDLQGPVTATGNGADVFLPSFAGAPGVSNLVFGAETLPKSNIVISTAGAVMGTDLTASVGGIDIDAGSIAFNALTATDGDVELTATGDITTGTVSASIGMMAMGGNIDADSTGGGTLDLGDLTADAGIALDTSGTLTANTVNAAGALTVGQTALPTATTFTGNVTAGSMDIDGSAAGTLTALDLTATASDIDVDVGSITADNVSAVGNIALDGAGTISLTNATADSDTSGAGDLSIGAGTSPAQLTISGVATGVNASLHADILNAATVTATGGDAVLSGGTITVGTVQATNDVIADATTSITLDTVTADSDTSGMGDVVIGQVTRPGQLSITTSVTGVNVTLEADTINVINGLSTNGDMTIRANTITLTDVTATGGDAILEAIGDVTTTSVTATAAGMSGGNIDIDSTGGGALDLGDLTADAGVTLDTTGSLTAGTVTAADHLVVGAAAAPSSVSLTGNVTAGSIEVLSTGAIAAQDLTATAGDIDLDGSAMTALDVSATGNVSADGAGTIAFASVTADSDGDLAGDVAIGTVTTPDTLTIAGATSGASVALQAGNSLTTDMVTAIAGDAMIQSGGAATTADVMASGNVSVTAGTALNSQAITAMGGDATLSATDVTAQAVQATGNVTVDGGGTISLASAIADSDMSGAGDLSIGTTTAPSTLTIAGASSGAATTLVSAGSLTADTVEATAGDASLTADTVIANTITATGGGVVLNVSGDATTNAISALTAGMAGGAIDVDSTAGGALSLGDLTADTDIAVDTTGAVSANTVAAGGALTVGTTAVPSSATFTGNVSAASVGIETAGALAAQDVTATAGSITANAAEITAGAVAATDAVTLDAAGAINLASAVADSDASGAGDLNIGTTTAPSDLTVPGAVSGANVTLVSTGGTSLGAVSTNAGDTSITSTDAATIASVATGELAIQSGGLLSIGAIDASGAAVLESADVDLQAAVDVDGASLTLRSAPDTGIGLGDGAGGYQLSDAELALVDTGTLVIDAVDQAIEIGGVSFTDQAGSDEVVLATSGAGSLIRIIGDVSGNGNGRIFRFGGGADMDAMVTERITMDIEAASIDFGEATFDLRGEDIAFGNQELIDAVAGRDSGDLALNIVGDANSLLYNPLLSGGIGGARLADPVYVRAGNISVTYGNSALFQNTAPPQEGGTLFTGVEIGQLGGNGTLALNAIDDTNTFALFGQINDLVGTAAALAGSNIILLGDDVRLPDSRVNGCVIGSGADCVTTIVGTTIISIPREAIELLTADAGLLVPFDPLVGTNNEGLFSDAAAVPDEDCERDENGACVG